jgi:hypothetical protein
VKLYVYALVPLGTVGPLGLGIEEEPLRLIPLGPLAAVVGELDGRPSVAPAMLHAHDDVIRAIARASDAVLPLPFGAMVTGEDELAEGLRQRSPALAQTLESTRGRDQMTLRLYADDVAPPDPTTSTLVVRVRDALGRLVRAERMELGTKPPLRITFFHLVDRARVDEYRHCARELSSGLTGARVEVTGPWPPYAFTEL